MERSRKASMGFVLLWGSGREVSYTWQVFNADTFVGAFGPPPTPQLLGTSQFSDMLSSGSLLTPSTSLIIWPHLQLLLAEISLSLQATLSSRVLWPHQGRTLSRSWLTPLPQQLCEYSYFPCVTLMCTSRVYSAVPLAILVSQAWHLWLR